MESDKKSWLRAFLLWGSRGMFAAGIVLLSLVGAATLQAKLYQDRAKQLIQSEIHGSSAGRIVVPATPIKENDILGRLDIPRIGISLVVLEGTDSRTLRLGAGHIETTSLPGEGGNVGIAGHRDTFFRPLRDIRKNDRIQIQTAMGLFQYQVDWMKVVSPEDVSVLAPSDRSVLTLVTCYPFQFFGSAPKRFIVRAHRY